MTTPNTPGFDGITTQRLTTQSAGRVGGESVNQPGQYPGSLFGVALPAGTGAAGSPGAVLGSGDPTNEPGQTSEGLSGLGPSVIADTGAPGSQGATNSSGGSDMVSFTAPGSYATGTNQTVALSDNVSGPNDWTQANDGSYGGAHQQLPGLNEPTATGAGEGRVESGAGRYRR